VQRHGPSIGGRQLLDANGNVLDKSYSGNYEVQFLNSSQIQLEVEWQSVTLTDPFDPSRTDGLELGENEELDWVTLSLSYNSDNRKPFSYNFSLNTGDFYNGKRSRIGGNFIFRNQPIYQLGVNFEYNKIDLPDPFNDADLFLVGPRFDLTLTNTVFFTTFVQYNTQDENLGHNSIFQRRFKPVSDLFIVYTDNYFTDNFSTRNRALVVKLSYWLNL
jgi:hypothetical protein